MTEREWTRKQLEKQTQLLKVYPEDYSQLDKDIWNLEWLRANIEYQSRNFRMGIYSSLGRAIEIMKERNGDSHE